MRISIGGLGVLACLFCASFTAGCYRRGCEADATCTDDFGFGEGGDVGGCPTDLRGGPVPERCGVWVSLELGNDMNSGSQGLPVKSLMRGIELASLHHDQVFACKGTYDEAVLLPPGISLSGGFECDQWDWFYSGETDIVTIEPAAGLIPLTLLEASGEERPSVVSSVRLKAKGDVDQGLSSIAVLAENNARADLWHCNVVTGDAGRGKDGTLDDDDLDDDDLDDDDLYGLFAPDGSEGLNGMDACSFSVSFGGGEPQRRCPNAQPTSGGYGGSASDLFATNGGDGLIFPLNNMLGTGMGGRAEDPEKGLPCTGGRAGAAGANGADGVGAIGRGRLTNEGYLGVMGGKGWNGRTGQGGGGGGASIGKAVCGLLPHGGAAGGSGGTGGCGGMAGRGGMPGGSSIGIASRSDGIRLFYTHIKAGNGGDGGNGGIGQLGGRGAFPGRGGLSYGGPNGVHAGCPGGIGGDGGDGGIGGGGHGGHSAAIAVVGDVQVFEGPAVFKVNGLAGFGGKGSLTLSPASDGEDGMEGPILQLDP